MKFDRVYAAIHLDRIEENMRAMQKNLHPGTKIIGTVKTDGYGHGAVAVAKTIDPYVAGYAVAAPEEALELRDHGVTKPVMILGSVWEDWYAELIEQDIHLTVFELSRAEKISETAVRLGKTAGIHIAVDVGMSRIGLFPNAASEEVVREIASLPGIRIEGLFTHFPRADEADKTVTRRQYAAFVEFRDRLLAAGVEIPVCHCSNSAGIVELPEANLDAVRAGITIYGMYPSAEVRQDLVPLKPAMELKSFITYLKEIPAGTAVSYGGTFVADRPTRVATISIGYGDGYPRNLSGKGSVLIAGKRARILGRVCMDQIMVDVTGIPEAREGMCVTLLGRDGDEAITMEELADLSGGFHYEIPCVLGKRVPRVYMRDGKPVGSMICFESRYEGF